MGDTPIEWTRGDDGSPGKTWNPVRGCSRVSEGCRHCYAEGIAARFSGEGQAYYQLARRTAGGEARWTGMVQTVPEHLEDPLRWRTPRRVFVNSMPDLFHVGIPRSYLVRVFAVMALARKHTFMVLTKRAGEMQAIVSDPSFRADVDTAVYGFGYKHPPAWDRGEMPWPLPNVWLGVSVEHQAAADERIPHLLRTAAALRFLSCEPLLGPVSLRWPKWRPRAEHEAPVVNQYDDATRTGLHWIIAGGESGRDARPAHPQWFRDLRDEARDLGIPFFFKQWGAWKPISEMADGEASALYEPPPAGDPEATRRCRVATRAVDYEGGATWEAKGLRRHIAYQTFEVGKHRAGHALDGETLQRFPTTEAHAHA